MPFGSTSCHLEVPAARRGAKSGELRAPAEADTMVVILEAAVAVGVVVGASVVARRSSLQLDQQNDAFYRG